MDNQYGEEVERFGVAAPSRLVTTASLYGRAQGREAPGPWARVLGRGAHERAIVLVSGLAGAGKSSLIGRSAHEVYPHGAVILSAEEADGPTVVERLQRMELASPHVYLLTSGGLPELIAAAQEVQAGAVFIDSASVLGLTGTDLIETARTLDMPVWASAHATKDGETYRGPSDLAHAADIVLFVLGIDEDGSIEVEIRKSRYSAIGVVKIER